MYGYNLGISVSSPKCKVIQNTICLGTRITVISQEPLLYGEGEVVSNIGWGCVCSNCHGLGSCFD